MSQVMSSAPTATLMQLPRKRCFHPVNLMWSLAQRTADLFKISDLFTSADHMLHLDLAHLIRLQNLKTALVIEQIKANLFTNVV